MKTYFAVGAVAGALIVLGAALWGAGEMASPPRQAAGPIVPSSGWIAFSSTTERVQQLVIADPVNQVLAVYHVDLASGRIALKSVRQVKFDLLMTEFNTDAPSPREVESVWKSP